MAKEKLSAECREAIEAFNKLLEQPVRREHRVLNRQEQQLQDTLDEIMWSLGGDSPLGNGICPVSKFAFDCAEADLKSIGYAKPTYSEIMEHAESMIANLS